MNPHRKFKGRVVFLGDRVKDGWGYAAAFEELSSSPASMEAGKMCDMWGCLPGHKCESSDGTQAYTQSNLGGSKKTFIRIPKHRWEGKLLDMEEDPLVPLERALYGHPDAGGYWENTARQR